MQAGEANTQEVTKICPSCGERVKVEALICHYCRYDFRSGRVATNHGGRPIIVAAVIISAVALVIAAATIWCVLLRFDDGSSKTLVLQESPHMQWYPINATTKRVELKITGSSPHGGRDYTAISEIKFR